MKWYGDEITAKFNSAAYAGLTAASITLEKEIVKTMLSFPDPIHDTGRLMQSITYKVFKDILQAVVGTNVIYALWVEYGTGIYAAGGGGRKTPWYYFYDKIQKVVKTKGMRPRPFMRKTYDEAKASGICTNVFAAQFKKVFK